MKKKTICVSLVACLMFAVVATAAPVVYNLTADIPVGFGGTLTWDSAVGNTFADGGISAFSLLSPGAPGVTFTETDNVYGLDIGVDGSLNPISLYISIADVGGVGDVLYTDIALDFTTGLGHLMNPDYIVIGPALTAVPEPATMSLLALGGLAMLRRRRRA